MVSQQVGPRAGDEGTARRHGEAHDERVGGRGKHGAAGEDAFFGKDPAHLVALKTAPYYLVSITYNQLGTVGGVIVNDQFQVLDDSRKAIPGLYSVGSDAYGTCWNRNYYGSGDGVGFALVSGYLCGPIAAAYALA